MKRRNFFTGLVASIAAPFLGKPEPEPKTKATFITVEYSINGGEVTKKTWSQEIGNWEYDDRTTLLD